MRQAFAAALFGLAPLATAAAAPSFVNAIAVPGDAADASGLPAGPNGNRLSFGSDLYFNPGTGRLYGLADRGPGGGLLSYSTRVHELGLTVNRATGAISNFAVQRSVLFRDGGASFNGLNPRLLNGDPSLLGRSQDPEGFVVGRNGNLFVADEYGPSVKEFRPDGTLLRSFAPPANLLPRQPNGALNFVDGRPTISAGRQDNRGFEGLAISPNGSKLYAMLQDPLVEEGSPDGRRSQNLRIVEYDVASGAAQRQFVYQLEALSAINDRIPGTANDFGANAQGRNIGISAIIALNATQFLVLERDNRGIGEADPTAVAPPASKRVFLIDIAGATDVSGVSLQGSNALPAGVTPVSKQLFLDIQQALLAAGQPIPEKIEGLTVGPRLDDGRYALLIATDNDFSVTQTGSGEQFNVCTDFAVATQVALGELCPANLPLIPSFLYAFAAELPGYTPPAVPAPGAAALLGAGLLGLLGLGRRRAAAAAAA